VATPRLMMVFTLATAGVVLIVAALATEQWWLLPVALLAHGVATAIVLTSIGRRTAQQDKPDPVTEARIEEEAKASDQRDEGPGKGDDEPRMAI